MTEHDSMRFWDTEIPCDTRVTTAQAQLIPTVTSGKVTSFIILLINADIILHVVIVRKSIINNGETALSRFNKKY